MLEKIDELLDSTFFESKSRIKALKLLDGERREVAIMFADMEGFTTLSERLDSEQVQVLIDKLFQLFTLCIKQYGGYIDKYEGDLVMALFGAKTAREHDTERAIKAGLQMIEKLGLFNRILAKHTKIGKIELKVRIGINMGLVTTGKIGEKREGDFTVYGDAVNLAARMESHSPLDSILIPERTMLQVKDKFDFESGGKLKVKGKTKPISVYIVKGIKKDTLPLWKTRDSPFVGRKSELDFLQKKYTQSSSLIKKCFQGELTELKKKPIVIGIKGEAGLGKSRLIHEFLNRKVKLDHLLQGTIPRISQNPNCLFSSLIKKYFNIAQIDALPDIRTKLKQGLEQLGNYVNGVAQTQQIHDTSSFLGSLLGIPLENDLGFDASERRTHIHLAIRTFIEAVAQRANEVGKPLLIVLEDLHWIDESSAATLEYLITTLNSDLGSDQEYAYQLFFVLGYRPDYSLPPELVRLTEFSEIELEPITSRSMSVLVRFLSEEMKIPNSLKKLLINKAAGNPFYLEEWFNLAKDFNQQKKVVDLPLPTSVYNLILSRIDRLEDTVKLLLQKAAVVGREFSVDMLEAIEKKLGRVEPITPQLQLLQENEFIFKQLGSEHDTYAFKHVITQEVAYNTLLVANRKILHHIVAQVIEEQFPDTIEEFYYDLAIHYLKAEDQEKAAFYLEKASDKAKNNFENERALAFYEHYLSCIGYDQSQDSFGDESPQFVQQVSAIFVNQAEIYDLIGKWDKSVQLLRKSLILAQKADDHAALAKANRMLGNQLIQRGEFTKAKAFCEESLQLYKELGDQMGIAMNIGQLGVMSWYQGDYQQAMSFYEQALSIYEDLGARLGIARTTGNIGIIYGIKGYYPKAMECFRKKLEIAQELGHRKYISEALGNMGIVYSMLGESEQAMNCYLRHLAICQELGDKRRQSMVTSDIGLLFYNVGQFTKARECFKKDLIISNELGDKNGLLRAMANLGLIYNEWGRYTVAMNYYKNSLKIAQNLGDKRGIALALGNIGGIFLEQENHEQALAYYEKKLKIDQDLDAQAGLMVTYFHFGLLNQAQKKYQQALHFYDSALEIANKFKQAGYIATVSYYKAGLLYEQEQYEQSLVLCHQGLEVAQKIKKTDMLFELTLLARKIQLHLARSKQELLKAFEQLEAMFQYLKQLVVENETRFVAAITYELWQALRQFPELSEPDQQLKPFETVVLHSKKTYRNRALALYQGLFRKTPLYSYKKRIDELEEGKK